MIAIDWGTTQFRARRVDPAGRVTGQVDAARGLMGVTDFPATLRELVGAWIAAGERRVIMCGMVGSRQGWVEAPYLPCPAGPADVAAALVPVPFPDAQIWLAPGLTARDTDGVPDVMRGEETQLLGALATVGDDGLVCLPGTHAKWARIAGGRIAGFTTFMTGEVFAALRGHTILGRGMTDAGHDPDSFARGVTRAGQSGGLLHQLFGVRALGLMDALSPGGAASYLSGLLIGHELQAAPSLAHVHLVGTPALCERYQEAIALAGGQATIVAGEPAIDGLIQLGAHASWN